LINNRPLKDIIFQMSSPFRVSIDRPTQIPNSIQGVWILNGPAGFKPKFHSHWLDGDGMIRILSLTKNTLDYRAVYVETNKRKHELKAKHPLYRTFGTAFDNDTLRKGISLHSPANVNAVYFGGKLLAFGEQSIPWSLDINKGNTQEEWTFKQKLHSLSQTSAHPKIFKNRFCNFGIKYLKNTTKLSYFEFDTSWIRTYKKSIELSLPHYIHDFLVTEQYALFYLSGYCMDIHKFISNKSSIMDSLNWDNSVESSLLILPRNSKEKPRILPLNESQYCLHNVNAYETNSHLMVDLLTCENPYFDQYFNSSMFLKNIKPTTISRYKINAHQFIYEEKQDFELGFHIDFPHIGKQMNGQHYSDFWSLGLKSKTGIESEFYTNVSRFNWKNEKILDSYFAPNNCFVAGEPCLLNGEDNSTVLIAQQYDKIREESSLIFLNPYNLKKGTLCSFPLGLYDPLGFHSSFISKRELESPMNKS